MALRWAVCELWCGRCTAATCFGFGTYVDTVFSFGEAGSCPYTLVPSSLDNYETHFTVGAARPVVAPAFPVCGVPSTHAPCSDTIPRVMCIACAVLLWQVMNYGRSLRQVLGAVFFSTFPHPLPPPPFCRHSHKLLSARVVCVCVCVPEVHAMWL